MIPMHGLAGTPSNSEAFSECFRVHLPLAYKAEERLAEATETIRYVGRGTWKRCSQWRKHLCYLDPALLSDTKGLAGHLPNLLFHDDR